MAVYLAGLAAAQLLWGALLNRLGPRRCLEVGLALLVLTSLGCAVAPNIETLLVLRLLQGVAAASPPSGTHRLRASARQIGSVRAMSQASAGPLTLGASRSRTVAW